ncbi:hypothetical protein SVIOM74S_04529 [Streptomyces violarus]
MRFVPSPIEAFFVSTYVPILPFAPSRVPGRRYANGPRLALRTHLGAHRHRVVHARARAHRVSVSRQFGTHFRTLAQVRRPVQLRARMHHGVLLERDRHIDPGRPDRRP